MLNDNRIPYRVTRSLREGDFLSGVAIIHLYRNLNPVHQMHYPQVKEQFVNDYLDAIAVGATHEEAVQLVAIENEVSEPEVLAEVEAA